MNIAHNIKNSLTPRFSGFFGIFASLGIAAFAPAMAFAQTLSNSTSATLTQTSTLNDLVTKVIAFFNIAIYLIIALAILTFVWNVYNYFVVNDPENKKDAGKYVMYSVIGIFVILSFWGLVNLISNTLNLNNNSGTVNVQNLIGNIAGNSSVNSPNAENEQSTIDDQTLDTPSQQP